MNRPKVAFESRDASILYRQMALHASGKIAFFSGPVLQTLDPEGAGASLSLPESIVALTATREGWLVLTSEFFYRFALDLQCVDRRSLVHAPYVDETVSRIASDDEALWYVSERGHSFFLVRMPFAEALNAGSAPTAKQIRDIAAGAADVYRGTLGLAIAAPLEGMLEIVPEINFANSIVCDGKIVIGSDATTLIASEDSVACYGFDGELRSELEFSFIPFAAFWRDRLLMLRRNELLCIAGSDDTGIMHAECDRRSESILTFPRIPTELQIAGDRFIAAFEEHVLLGTLCP